MVTDNIFTPAIDKKLSKFPHEIATKIKESVTDIHCYINAAWESKLNHFQKMAMIYLGGKISNSEDPLEPKKQLVSISEVVFYTGITKADVLKVLQNLIKNGYLKSIEFSIYLDEEFLFSYSITQKIINEYLLKIIRDNKKHTQ